MRYFKNSITFVLSFLMGLFFIEIYFQVSEIATTSTEVKDQILGSKLVSGKKYLFHNEGFSIGSINNLGYYGKLYNKDNSKDSVKIALVGDSYVEAIQVFERHHFGYKLEKLLNNSGYNSQVLNFGRSGFNLIDSYCYYENFIKDFNTDLNIIFISPGDLVPRGEVKNRPNVYMSNGELKIDYTPNAKVDTKFDFLRGKSILLSYANRTIKKITSRKKITSEENKNILFELSDVQKKIILNFNNNNFIFVIHNESLSREYDYLLDEFIDFSKKNNIEVIDLKDLFSYLRKRKINFNYWPLKKIKGHFNHNGHNEIANYLFPIIKNKN